MLKIGHRGASGYAPENTLASFRQAMRMGADGIELDTHLCKSGELVVIHDDTVDRTTGGKGALAAMTLSELRALVIKDQEGISTLSEVFDALGPNAYYFVEIKHANAALATAALMEGYMGKGWPSHKMMLISFQHDALREAKNAVTGLSIGASFEQIPKDGIAFAAALGAKAILPNYRMLKESHMEQARGAGLDVITWTVNDYTDISRTRSLQPQGIMSDYPDRLLPRD